MVRRSFLDERRRPSSLGVRRRSVGIANFADKAFVNLSDLVLIDAALSA